MVGFLAPLLGPLLGGAGAAAGGATLGGALAAAAPNLLGSALSMAAAGKARDQAQQDAANKFVDLRAAAIAGGFSPLTALQATGGAGYGAYPSSAPPLASIELLTGAAKDLSFELTGQGAVQRQADRVNLDIAKLQLDQARAGVRVNYAPQAAAAVDGKATFGFPTSEEHQTSVSVGGYDENGVALGSVPVPDRFLDRASGVYLDGHYVPGAPGWSDAQTIEDNYGEVGAAAYGFLKAGADAAHWVNRKWRGDAIVDHISPDPSAWTPLQMRNGNYSTVHHAGPLAKFN